MAFDPDEYLNETGITSSTATAEFDPDAYLSETEEQEASFDPDTYLAEVESTTTTQPAQPQAPVGTSIGAELAAIPQAFVQAVEQPTEAIGETAEVLGMPRVGAALRGVVEAPEGYVSAAQRFMQPQEGEFQIGGFAPQFLPRAIVEQAGQIAGAIATRAAGAAIGGLAGSVVGPKGTIAGAVAGQFLGPALFEMSQVVGPVARERAANQGRETPNGDDLGWAWATAGASGALNAIGARYLPNGDKLAGGLAKRISQSFIGEGIPEGGQAAVQQIGETFLTEQGLDLRPKEIAGEALIGGGAGAAAVGVAAPFTKASTAAETKVVAEQAAPVAPETAQVVSEQANQVIAEAQAEETAETPEQRVARLQAEAQAAREITLEEQPPVTGLPPVSELPPVKEGFVRLYHGGASATAGEFTPYLDTALGYAQQSKGSVFYVDVPENSEFLRREQYDEQGNITDRGILISRQSQVPNEIAQTAQRAASGFEAEPVTPPVTLTPEAAPTPEIAQAAQARITEREGQAVTPVEEPAGNRVEAAAYQAPDGTVYYGPSHLDAMAKARDAGKIDQAAIDAKQEVTSRETPEFGFATNADPFVTRDQAEAIARQSGQITVEQPATGKLHSNEVSLDAFVQPVAPEAAPAAVEPTPVTPPVTPQLEPLRRVARAEQTEEDVAGLVDGGLVELYKGQPVITQAGIDALPEAERPRLTPEARKIQIDTGASDMVAEAISKNLRIGVDQVPIDFRMPAGWTLVEDIYVPPTRMERIAPSDIETVPVTEEAADVFANVSKVVAPRLPESNPETASSQEIAEVVSKYQTSEPTARMILANTNFEAKEVGVLPEGWAIETIDGQDIALSPIWQKSRRDLQVAIRKLTAIERGALSARLVKEGWINEDQAKEYLRNAIARSSQEQVTAAEAEANERFDSLVEGIIRENRASVSSVVGEIPKPTFDLEAEERARSAKPPISPSRVLDPNEIEFMSARQALKLLAEANIVHRGYQGFEGTGDADAQGNALWRTTGNVDKPRYALIQEAASILSKTNLRILDAERINISGRPSGRAYRSWEGHVYVPRTSDGETLFVEPWILVHEIGHTLTIDALRKYVVQREATGEAYYKRLKNALADKNTPREVKRAVKLYIDTIKALNLEKEYFKKNGLAGDGDRGIRNASARDVKKIINPFTGKQITTDDMYALADIHEFYAQAWNAESFQDILKQIKVEPQRSAFQKFVDIIKDILGFESDTMAYAVIDASLRLASLEAGDQDIKQTIKRTEALRFIKELPRNKLTWSNTYSTRRYPEYVSDGIKMARNRFTKLGYDQIKFRIKKSAPEEWTVFAEISESYKRSKPSNAYLQNQTIFTLTLSNKASVQEVAERLSSDINGLINEKYLPLMKAFRKQKSAPSPPQAPPTEAEPAPEPEGETPTFTEGTPEAATLKEMEASMAKVDAASEAKGGKPETYKISEIASVWMDSGLGERELQDAIVEYTNLTPANAARVAKAIARQYDIQQSIATAMLETPAGLSVEALPKGVTLPKEVDPDRPKPVMQRLFEVFMGVRVPPTKITVNEKAALKDQIRLKAAANRAAKDAQKATAAAVIETIKQMELRGPVRPKQAQALAKRAARVIWTSEKSVEAFTEYAAKVVENTNYDADVREAKAAQNRAKELSKQKTVAMSPQRQVLEDIGKISIGSIDDPRLFADTVNYYLRAFKKVTSPDYVVIPDSEMTSYLSQLENQEIDTNAERERVSNEKLAEQYGLPVSQVEALLNSQDIIRDLVAYAKREQIESILNQKIGDIQTALKAYDQNQLRPDQRKLVDSLLAIDAKGLDAKEKQSLIRIGNNVIYNNQTNGAQYFVAVANGQQNARQAAQDFKTIEKNRAWIDLIPTLGSKRVAETMRNWSLELQSVADTFRNIFGKESMAKIFRQMGMYNLDRGFTDAANVLDQIQEKMAEFYKKNTKKYGKAARDQNGILSEGVVGFLIQQVPAKGEAESIAQRRDLIKQDIANRRSSQQADKIEMANRIEEILGKVDGNTVEEILANMKANYRPNYDSLTYLMNDLLPQYKDFLKQFDENFNDQANNYDNPYYLPIAFVRSGPELEITPESESMFYEGMSLRPRQAANTIKRVDYSVLPTDKSGNPKEIQFNLRRGTYDSLSDQINKAYTNEAWQQIFSFMKTADADAIFGGRANKDFMAERLNRLRISRMRRGSANNGAISKFADSVSVLARKIGTGIALGGVFQVFKQSPDQLISALGTTGRYDLLGEHVMTIGSAKKLLDKFSIGRRGDASSGYKYINQMEGAQNRLERAFTESRWSEVKENASKVADVWMVALKKTDFLCAASAWMTYYRANLDKNGIKFEGWDKEAQLVDTDPSRQDAASYAEQMTDIYQGSSDPTKMATFAQSGKSGWENFVKAALVPFNSFAVQQRMRIYSDGRDSFTKAGETGALGRFGLASTIGGLVAFHTMRRLVLPTITGAGVYALYGMLGVDMDEPDDEKKKEEARKAWRQFQGELLANTLVGGAPQFVEAATIDAFNYANYLVSLQLESEDIIDDNGEIMDFSKYQKERSPFWRYQSFKNAPSFGMFDVGLGQAEKVAVQTKQLMDREQMEMYTPEEQRLLYFSTLSEWLYLMRLNDADLARMVGKARRDMIKAAEDREKQLKAIREGR